MFKYGCEMLSCPVRTNITQTYAGFGRVWGWGLLQGALCIYISSPVAAVSGRAEQLGAWTLEAHFVSSSSCFTTYLLCALGSCTLPRFPHPKRSPSHPPLVRTDMQSPQNVAGTSFTYRVL